MLADSKLKKNISGSCIKKPHLTYIIDSQSWNLRVKLIIGAYSIGIDPLCLPGSLREPKIENYEETDEESWDRASLLKSAIIHPSLTHENVKYDQ